MERVFFKIIFLTFALEAFSLTIEPSFPKIKEEVLVKGEGYMPNEDITIILEKETFRTKATRNGTFSFSFFISQGGGKKVITAKGKTRLETTLFYIKPKIEVFPLKGTRDTKVTINGEGYSPYEKIQIGLGRNSLVAWATASKTGTFSQNFIITNQPYGTQTLFAVGHLNYLDDRKDFFIEPYLTIIPKKASIGSPIVLSGTGFYPSDGPGPGEHIIVDFGSYQTLAVGYTNYYGSFEIPLNVPFCKGGLNIVKIRGGDSNLVSSFDFEVLGRIEQFPKFAYPTKPIRIKGDGFLKNETLTLTLEKRMEGTKTFLQKEIFLTDENGAFSVDFLVETQPRGIKKVTIEGAFGFYKETSLEIKPFIDIVELDTKYGTLTLKGGGFMEQEGVSFSFGGPRFIGKTTTDKDGFFLVTFKVFGMQKKERIIAEGMKSHEITIGYGEENFP